MTRVTFDVSASSFAANMALKQNLIDNALQYPLAANAVERSFYMGDCLTGADTKAEAMLLQKQLQDLFSLSGFLLRKWNSSEGTVLDNILSDLRLSQSVQSLPA